MKAVSFLIPVVLAAMPFRAVAVPAPAGASLVQTVEWQTAPPGAQVVPGGPDRAAMLSVRRAETTPVSLPLWSAAPDIHAKCYALHGQIKYRGVQGVGYLEMWNEFPPETAGQPAPKYFSRTLAEVGPLEKITGTSEWRPLWLPFDATQSKLSPRLLTLNLVIPGAGEVDLSKLELFEFADAGAMWAAAASDSGATGFQPNRLTEWPLIAGGGLALLGLPLGFLLLKHRRDQRRMRALDLA